MVFALMAYGFWKRRWDLLAASLMLVLTAPLWIAAALALFLTQGRPLLFRQRRVGRHGAPFTLLKFRTMIDAAPARYPDRPVAKRPDDPRVTPLGRVLRRFAIDELPQLVNILRGEMSLVGPRPLPEEDLSQPGWLDGLDETERARRLAWLQQRHTVLPGLTGAWQITREPAENFENWIACDLAYVARRSFLYDLRILLHTPRALLRGRAAVCRHSEPDRV